MRRVVIAVSVDGIWPTAPVTIGTMDQIHKTGFPDVRVFADDVVRARNRLARTALTYDATHVLWWDTDQYVSDPAIVTRMLDIMDARDLDVLGAAYPRKRKKPSVVGIMKPGGDMDTPPLVEMLAVGFGFTLTTRRALEAVEATWYTDTFEEGERRLSAATRNIFGHVYVRPDGTIAPDGGVDTTLVSEDYSFCARWLATGGRVWMYAGEGAPVLHVGTYAFGS